MKGIAKELGVNPKNPAGMYQLMNAVSLAAARIRVENAMQGSKALIDAGWTTPEKMLDTSWEDRVKVLNRHGYARYDESRARFLEHNARLAKDKYNSNLTVLLKKSPKELKQAVQEFKGIGPTGANIFYREVKKHMKQAADQFTVPNKHYSIKGINRAELHEGTVEEHEHTSSNGLAKQIAIDHLKEDGKYYTHLEKVEKKLVSKEGNKVKEAAFLRGFMKAAMIAGVAPHIATTMFKETYAR